MKLGKFIMNGNHLSVENKKPFSDEESEHNRRAVDLYDNGGLVAFRNKFVIPDECNSPYKSYSAFSGNPYFIDPEQLVQQGLLLPLVEILDLIEV